MSIFLQQPLPTLIVRAKPIFVFLLILASLPCTGWAQENKAAGPLSTDSSGDLKEQVRELRMLVEQLQKQVSDLQARVPATQLIEKVGNPPSAQVSVAAQPTQVPNASTHEKAEAIISGSNQLSAQGQVPTPSAQEKTQAAAELSPTAAPSESQKISDFLHGTTVNLLLDGYYEYNFNAPIAGPIFFARTT